MRFLGVFLCFLGVFLFFARQRDFFLGVNFIRGTTPKRGIPALVKTTKKILDRGCQETRDQHTTGALSVELNFRLSAVAGAARSPARAFAKRPQTEENQNHWTGPPRRHKRQYAKGTGPDVCSVGSRDSTPGLSTRAFTGNTRRPQLPARSVRALCSSPHSEEEEARSYVRTPRAVRLGQLKLLAPRAVFLAPHLARVRVLVLFSGGARGSGGHDSQCECQRSQTAPGQKKCVRLVLPLRHRSRTRTSSRAQY